jgi:hypothetical protein
VFREKEERKTLESQREAVSNIFSVGKSRVSFTDTLRREWRDR